MNSYSTCKVCGDGGHSGNDCPETHEEAAYNNNNNNTRFRPQGGQGWGQAHPPFQGGSNNFNSNFNSSFNSNQPSLRDLVFGQAKINESLNKKLAANDKILESINAKVETLSSALKNQSSFNKKVESLLAQIAASVPVSENVKAVTTRGGKSTRDPPHPNHAEKAARPQVEEEESTKHDDSEESEEENPQKTFVTNILPFASRKQKITVDEQFTHFVEMIQKIHVNVPLLDIMHVPTYARYINTIINNKRPLPTMEVVKLTEECSAAILNQPPKTKEDLGCPTINCSIGTQHYGNTLCDLGASVSVMPKVVFDKLNFMHLTPTAPPANRLFSPLSRGTR